MVIIFKASSQIKTTLYMYVAFFINCSLDLLFVWSLKAESNGYKRQNSKGFCIIFFIIWVIISWFPVSNKKIQIWDSEKHNLIYFLIILNCVIYEKKLILKIKLWGGKGNIGVGKYKVQTIRYKITYKDILYSTRNTTNILQ